MLKFVKNHMASIGGIEIYPMISFLIFFTFFLVVTWLVIKMSKEKVNILSSIPLENEKPESQSENN